MKLDTALVLAAKAGDAQSFTSLYEAVAPSLYRSALYALGNSHDAEDVVSETFLEAYHGISGLRDPEAFGAWIYRILSARCKRKIKEYVKGRNQLDIEDFLELPGDQDQFTEQTLQRVELVRALEQLSPREREIVCLSVFDGYTAREIAQMLGSPQGTISAKLFRALKKMRKFLEKNQ